MTSPDALVAYHMPHPILSTAGFLFFVFSRKNLFLEHWMSGFKQFVAESLKGHRAWTGKMLGDLRNVRKSTTGEELTRHLQA